MIPFENTFLVVNKGKVSFDKSNLNCGGAKSDFVPVPVLSGRCSPSSIILLHKSRYACSAVLGDTVICSDLNLFSIMKEN